MTDAERQDEPQQKPLIVNCPTCHKKSIYSKENSWRPFCSQRCKLIDIGAWASEAFKLPEQSPSNEDEAQENE